MDEVNNKFSVKTGNLPFRAVKNSVFKSLFSDNKYLLQLYRTLHPEDTDVTEDDLEHKTLETVIARDILNDLGFAVRDKLLILVEAQSTLTVNILVRILMYLLRTYQNFFRETKQNLYGSKPVRLPKPELYVIYTGNKSVKKDIIKLSEEFFGGNMAAIEVSAEIITLHEENDIINQYIMFSKIIDEQIKIYGRTPKAVIEAIRICKDANILKEYLEKHEKEVVDIMEELYDQKAIFAMFAESERAEGREEGREEGVIKTTLSGIKNLMQNMKLTAEQAMQALSIPVSEWDKYHSLLGEN